jgi:hypothetical protein
MSIALFEQTAASLLSKLYECFPHKTRISQSDFHTLTGGGGSTPPDWQLYTDTIEFLANEGFVRHGEPHLRHERGTRIIDIWPDLVLTAKGLSVLYTIPQCLQPAEPAKPLGERIGEAVKSGATTAIGALMKEVVNTSVKLLAGSF